VSEVQSLQHGKARGAVWKALLSKGLNGRELLLEGILSCLICLDISHIV
jgi:hypothetical protein